MAARARLGFPAARQALGIVAGVGLVAGGLAAPASGLARAALPTSGIDLCAIVGRNAGWEIANGELVMAVAIAMAESRCTPSAVNTANANGSTDRGLWQINSVHSWVTPACALDAQCNANAAYKISSGGANWRPWSVYKSTRHLPFLGPAREAVARLAQVADGQLVRFGGQVYRVAGGAPLAVSEVSRLGAAGDVLELTEAQWSTLSQVPRDGTFLVAGASGAAGDGEVYRVAGGAPVYVSDWAAVGGDPGTAVRVDIAAIEQAGGEGPWAHLRFQPIDGTVLRAGARTYKVLAGAPVKQVVSQAGTAVDPAAIANAGQPGRWSHLAAPAGVSPTPGTSQTGNQVKAPGTAKSLRYRSMGKGATRVTWAPPSAATGYKVRISRAGSATKWRSWRAVSSPAATFTKLVRGSRYRVQVVAVGPGGSGKPATLRFTQRR